LCGTGNNEKHLTDPSLLRFKVLVAVGIKMGLRGCSTVKWVGTNILSGT